MDDIKTEHYETSYGTNDSDIVTHPIVVFDTFLNQPIPNTEEELNVLEDKIKDMFANTRKDPELQEYILNQHKAEYNEIKAENKEIKSSMKNIENQLKDLLNATKVKDSHFTSKSRQTSPLPGGLEIKKNKIK